MTKTFAEKRNVEKDKCRYKDDCKFLKSKNCAFKHPDTKRDVAYEDFQNKIKISTDDIVETKTAAQ